ncbi:Deoxyuridine 5'-triphosphate nucleotidohydrolase [Podospora pseudocomata]|uniref:Deoxyuridine 5'-triphosphate nucleotidohydrolase n=1 Tax=Podospora pseudocomata TaxID=2093779 RepID=A0ABR0GUS8_9PEZI|nr:Deoxyuridine 5'-triphosphate nucleotidohydrolase [Podospora pseudocomata]
MRKAAFAICQRLPNQLRPTTPSHHRHHPLLSSTTSIMTATVRNDPIVPTSPPAAKRLKTDTNVPDEATSSSSTTTTTTKDTTTTAEGNTTTNSATTTTTTVTTMAAEPAAVPSLQVKKLSSTARLPTRGSAFAAGYDLYASKDTTIPARGKALVDTDISIAVPANTYGRIAPRSGLAAKHFIDTGAGVIDADYRGPVKVLLFNHADSDFEVKEGDRIAQLIVERIFTPEVVEVQELEESVRGAGGFGSTGGFGAAAAPVVN